VVDLRSTDWWKDLRARGGRNWRNWRVSDRSDGRTKGLSNQEQPQVAPKDLQAKEGVLGLWSFASDELWRRVRSWGRS